MDSDVIRIETGRDCRALTRQIGLAPVWGSWLAILLILGLLQTWFVDNAWVGEVAVLLHVVVAIVILLRNMDRFVVAILCGSLLLRVAMMFWDLNFSDVWSLPNSGADSEDYYHWAIEVAKDPSLIYEEIRLGMYSKLIGLLFWLVGPLRVVGQYTNVLLGLSVVLLVKSTMDRLPSRPAKYHHVLVIFAFLPNALIMSAIFLRESLISFLIAVSVYFFVRWALGRNPLTLMWALAAVLAASTLHAGVIAVGVGYMFVVLVYRRDTGRFGLTPQSIIYLALFVVIVYFTVARYPDLFLGQFEEFESEEDLLTSTNRRGAGSEYLTGLTVSSYGEMLLFGPIRALFFLASPMPWDWRGLTDMFTFATDSLFFIGAPLLFFIRRKHMGRRERALGWALMVAIVVASLVFGAGVSNAGTAVRHRYKLVSLFMVLMAITAGRIRHAGRPPGGRGEVDLMPIGRSNTRGTSDG